MADKRTPVRGKTRIYRTGSGRYEAHVEPKRVGGKRQKPIVETFATLKAADDWQTATKAQVKGNTYVDRKTSPTVLEQMRAWQARQTHHRYATAKIVRLSISRIEGTDLADILLADLGREDIQKWVSDLLTRYAPGTVRMSCTWLRAMLNDAVYGDPPRRGSIIPTSPFRKIKIPSGPSANVLIRADRLLTVDQVDRLADAMPEPWLATMVRCQAGSGVRASELLGWRVKDINFPRRQLHLTSQVLYENRPNRSDLKTSGSARVVPLPWLVIHKLNEHLRRYPPLDTWDGLIFYRPDRQPVWGYNKFLARASRRLHAADPSFPVVSSHDLRHHYVSHLIYKGHSPVAIGARIGDDPARVWDTYAHMWPGTDDDTRDAIDEAYGVTAPGAPPRPAVAFRVPSVTQNTS